MEDKANRKLIGKCGFISWDTIHHKAEIGYALSRMYWNQGMMTEAAKEVMKFGFDVMQLNRLEARCNIEGKANTRRRGDV